MPFHESDIFLYFKKEIEDSANQKIKELQREIEATKKKTLDRIEEEVRDNANRVIDTELNEINADFSASMNRIKTQVHQEIIKRKLSLLDTIIDEVKQKCLAFVKTDQYRKNMELLVKKIDDEFCGDDFVFQIKKNDKILEAVIKDYFSKSHTLEKVDTIEIGGFIGICTKKGILTDQTIDNKLERARTKFFENSKLAINQ